MVEARTLTTVISVGIAAVAVGWAIYATKHSGDSGGGNAAFSRPQGGGGPGGGGAGGPQVAQVVPVVTAEAVLRPMEVGIEAIGTANANEAVNVTSKSSNIVTAIHFTDGQAVRSGQLLVELDSAQARADLAAATADFTESAAQYNRSRDLVASQVVSQSQYDQLQGTMQANEARVAAAKARLGDTVIRAPFSGRVGLRRVSVGTLIAPGTVITTLDDISTIKVDFAVPDLYVGQLHSGQNVTARASAYPGRSFGGRVVSVDSRIDPTTRSVTVRALVPNSDAALKPGMFLTVDLAKESRQALVVPEEALVPEQARMFIYVVAGNAVQKREVQLGRREPGRVEITTGISAGERVVVEGTLKLRDGSPVSELNAAAPPAEATPEVRPAS